MKIQKIRISGVRPRLNPSIPTYNLNIIDYLIYVKQKKFHTLKNIQCGSRLE